MQTAEAANAGGRNRQVAKLKIRGCGLRNILEIDLMRTDVSGLKESIAFVCLNVEPENIILFWKGQILQELVEKFTLYGLFYGGNVTTKIKPRSLYDLKMEDGDRIFVVCTGMAVPATSISALELDLEKKRYALKTSQLAEVEPHLGDFYDTALGIDNFKRGMESPVFGYPENTNITPAARGPLVYYLVCFSRVLNFKADTLHAAVRYVDKYISLDTDSITDIGFLHILGVICLHIASKYEEVRCPVFKSYLKNPISGYTMEELQRTERTILQIVGSEIGCPTVQTSLQLFAIADPAIERSIFYLASYLAELSLYGIDCLRFRPSEIAFATIFMATYMVDPMLPPWRCGDLPDSSRLMDCVSSLHGLHFSTTPLLQLPEFHVIYQVTKAKYMSSEFNCVAELPIRDVIPRSYYRVLYPALPNILDGENDMFAW